MTPPITTPMRLARIAFVLASLFALTMALLPMPPRTPIDGFGDKFAHVTAFAVMTALASLGWPRAASWRQLAGLSAFGALIEVLQAIPALHRDSQLSDWIADTAAIAAILAIALVVRARRRSLAE
ncbi:hypothetical protein ACOYW6_00475 [Parablastomonas sp. CN1-191]|uniref:hypothetical protein n=1 Tax=Parablastomonas sp. CN1-191 TaxID=3400908 RepID=UPI003BF87193